MSSQFNLESETGALKLNWMLFIVEHEYFKSNSCDDVQTHRNGKDHSPDPEPLEIRGCAKLKQIGLK